MDRRWAPVLSAVAVAVLVGGVVVAVDPAEDEPRAAPSLAAASPSASAAPSPEPEPSAEVGAQVEAGESAEASAPPSPKPEPSVARSPQAPSPAPPRPSSAPPAAASPPPPTTTTRSAFGFDAAYGTDDPREVVVQYGDSSSCPHENVTHRVEESPDRVVVTLEADAMDPGRACTADYQQRLVPVRLDAPLGDRVLVDGSRGEPVEVDRSCSRPFPNPPPPRDCEP